MKPSPFVLCGLLVLAAGCVPQMIMKSQDRNHYSAYVQTTNQLNTDREKSGLAPIRVMTFEEWHGDKK